MEPEPPLEPLPREFYERDTESVARALLGAWLLRATADGLAGGPIVETEAYLGPGDQASHARAGKTPRTTHMFGQAGHAYVYLVYGMHECLNVVAYANREAGAVLIRAVEPRVGLDLIRTRRGRSNDPTDRLAAGPGRLTQALAVTRAFDGHDLTTGLELWVAAGESVPDADVECGPRIGVDYAGPAWADKPLRFWIAGSSSVSKPR